MQTKLHLFSLGFSRYNLTYKDHRYNVARLVEHGGKVQYFVDNNCHTAYKATLRGAVEWIADDLKANYPDTEFEITFN